MRSRVRKFAHVLERIGLAMAGAASGLFVAAPCGVKHRSVHVRGFYSHDDDWWRSWVLPGNRCSASGFSCTIWSACKGGSSVKVDSAEFLSAVGTFLATLTAFVSVIVIVLREDPHIYWTMMTMLRWVVGVLMQIIAGAIARTRA
jgi:hypothetical protein